MSLLTWKRYMENPCSYCIVGPICDTWCDDKLFCLIFKSSTFRCLTPFAYQLEIMERASANKSNKQVIHKGRLSI